MGQAQVEDRKYTIEEWLELEASQGIRYEYHFGRVYAMVGGTLNHAKISGNAFRLLENSFVDRDADCQAFISDLKIEVTKEGLYFYPDTLAVCGKVQESDSIAGAIVNPVLVVEVTSKSSQTYDRTTKYDYYTALPSVKQYMIVSQSQPFVTLYNRNPTTKKFDSPPNEVRGLMGEIDLSSVSHVMSMKALYRNVKFDKADLFLRSIK